MRLIFVGGIAGVGKSTLIRWLARRFPGRVRTVDPGALFRRYHYRRRIMTTGEVEDFVVERILDLPTGAVVVIHWHYAVRRPDGCIPQVAFRRLRRLLRSGKIERAVLLLVYAPNDAVRTRRRRDVQSKRRPLSLATIEREVAAERRFLKRQRMLFEHALGRGKATVRLLRNTNLRRARSALVRLVEDYRSGRGDHSPRFCLMIRKTR